MSHSLGVLAHHGKSFYWAGRWLPGRTLQRAARLYALCRVLDDAVDQAQSKAQARQNLQLRKEELSPAFETLLAEDPHPVVPDSLCRKAFLELIAGMEEDIEHYQPATEHELLRYCYRAAGTVGILMARILRVKNSAAIAFAIDLGMAMQLTNIARDIKEDSQRGRVYLPQNYLKAEDLRHVSGPAVSRLLNMADYYYESGRAGMAYIPFAYRPAILIASNLYQAIGTPLKRDPDLVWEKRVSVSPARKIWLTLGALGQLAFRPKFWTPSVSHSYDLHVPLKKLPGVGI